MIPPRFIRLRDAPAYLGMDRSVFNLAVRPALTEVSIGKQGVAFDRLDLDAWADEYMRCNGRAGKGANAKWRDEARPQESQPIVQVTKRSTRSDFGGRRRNSGVKNGEDRIVVLNRVARSVIEECRGQHPEFVFVYQRRNGKRYQPVLRMNNTAWQRAREACQLPVRVHDLKHTFGRRLRAAGVGLETRKVLLGHKNDDYLPRRTMSLRPASHG